MGTFINYYEIIYMYSYRGHKAQGEGHKEASSSALWPTGLVISVSIAALIKGLIQTLGGQVEVNQLALGLGVKNGFMSLIVLVSIVISIFLVNVFLKMRINNLNIKFKHININHRRAMVMHFSTAMGSMLIFLYIKENALIIFVMQTFIFSYLATKCVEKST